MATRAEWAVLVEEWKASGEAADIFATKRGVKSKQLQWWGSLFVRESKKRSTKSTASALSFARVEAGSAKRAATPVTTVSPANATLEIVLRRGCTVRVARGFDRELLASVVDALEAR